MRVRLLIGGLIVVGLFLGQGDAGVVTRAAGLPAKLADADFWQIVATASEPNGYFRSPNLTSNEFQFQWVIPDLVRRTERGHRPGVYLGVGPEQNFTYIAAVRPAMAVIIDIRRGNLLLQLMYKALFEMSRDRADFVSLLFSRPRPDGLDAQSTVTELLSKFGAVSPSDEAFVQNLQAIDDRLRKQHQLPLLAADVEAVEHIYEAFYSNGFTIRYSPTYDELMTATDQAGVHRSYLSSEESFAFVKDLQMRNLVIPVVGDFGGPLAIRRIGDYLRAHGATVSAFYLSNVEQYLDQDGKAVAFCRSVATLPLDSWSTFIRSSSRGFGYGYGRGFESSLGAIEQEVKDCRY
jgi:hypothetical protein